MRIDDIARAAGGVLVRGNGDARVTSITYDSRDASEGGLFVALRGGYVDGHDFLTAARHAGALAAMVLPGTDREALAGFQAVIEVADTRAALAPVASAFFGRPSTALTVIGITGTDGKTTTSYFVDAVCRSAGLRTGLIGTVEVRVGDDSDRHASRQTTPESLLVQQYLAQMRDAGVNTAIVEATSHGLAMHRLDECEFDVGVVTNITHEHLDFHGTVEQYRAAKGRLLRQVSDARTRGKRGIVVINRDDEGARSVEHLASGCQVITFSGSGSSDADVTALHPMLRTDGSSFELGIGTCVENVDIQPPGRHNIDNAVAAAATGHALGIDVSTIARGLSTLSSVPGRMERIDEEQPFTVVVDYAHSPAAIRGVLMDARRVARGRVLVLFGSAGERDVEKRSIQGAIAAQLADFSVFTSEDPRYEDPLTVVSAIAAGAAEAGAKHGVDFECIEDRSQAIARILEYARAGDVVILAGKGHERSMIYGNEFRPWNEADVARNALRALGYRPDVERRITDS